MQFGTIVQRVEARLVGLGKAMIQADRASDLLEEIDLVRAERDRLSSELASARARHEEVRRRLEEKQCAAALLVSQVESSFRRAKTAQAMRQALELDRLRREVADEQATLPRLDQACWSLEFRLRQVERKLERLRDELTHR